VARLISQTNVPTLRFSTYPSQVEFDAYDAQRAREDAAFRVRNAARPWINRGDPRGRGMADGGDRIPLTSPSWSIPSLASGRQRSLGRIRPYRKASNPAPGARWEALRAWAKPLPGLWPEKLGYPVERAWSGRIGMADGGDPEPDAPVADDGCLGPSDAGVTRKPDVVASLSTPPQPLQPSWTPPPSDQTVLRLYDLRLPPPHPTEPLRMCAPTIRALGIQAKALGASDRPGPPRSAAGTASPISPRRGAASNMWLLSQNNRGMTIDQALRKWSRGSRGAPPGYNPNRRITDDLLNDPQFMTEFMRSVAADEPPGRYPMDAGRTGRRDRARPHL
jgi:hypothetical protein